MLASEAAHIDLEPYEEGHRHVLVTINSPALST
jgi:hypothetical protein